MRPPHRNLFIVALIAVLVIVVWLVLAQHCPSAGIGLTAKQRTLHRLKNRTAVPQPADFDTRITLDQLLQPGNDHDRWSTERAARIQGYVIDVAYARPEATNCYIGRDIHILVANRKEAGKNEHVVV